MPIGFERNTTGWYSSKYHLLIRVKISEAREAKGMSIATLATHLKMTYNNLDYIEHHQVKPGIEVLARCAQVLGVESWADLIEIIWLEEPQPITTEEAFAHAD